MVDLRTTINRYYSTQISLFRTNARRRYRRFFYFFWKNICDILIKFSFCLTNITLLSNRSNLFKLFFITLLNQNIDNFDLNIVENKLKIIRELKLSITLKYLKIYLNKINYLRQCIVYYAHKTQVLQRRKMYLFSWRF